MHAGIHDEDLVVGPGGQDRRVYDIGHHRRKQAILIQSDQSAVAAVRNPDHPPGVDHEARG